MDKKVAKLISDLEKRLKFVEDRGKVLADTITSSKDIEKLLDVHTKRILSDPAVSNKQIERYQELAEKQREADRKEWEKALDHQDKEQEKLQKKFATEADKARLEARLALLEKKVNAALAKK